MAVTQNTYTGNGSTVLYSFTFPYLETTDIKVSVNGTVVTTYTFANATTIQFNTAPANGAAIRIYRQTDDSALPATFYSGSAIRSADLNDNFTQNLYVTQESTNNAATATTTANTALSNSSTALSQSNTAIADSATALSQSNTAISDSATALSQSNTAISDSASAVSTANTASTNASNAVTTANTALSTANTASSNASAAVSTANTASSNASAAVSTANTASSNASTALSTANTALSTATTADTNATAALNAVAGTVQYMLVANVAAIPGTPGNGDAIEIADSTGIESFTPLTNLPAGYVGDPGLSVRLQYLSAGSSWNWLNYFANNAETRYLKLAGGSVTGNLEIGAAGSLTFEGTTANTFETTLTVTDPTADRTITLPNVTGTVVTTGDTGSVTSTMIANGTIVDADVNASAAIAGTKVSPNFGSQTITTTGVVSAAAGAAATPSITFTGDTNTGIYSPGADQVAISTAGSGRLFVDASGRVGVNTNSPTTVASRVIHVSGSSGESSALRLTGNAGTGLDFIQALNGDGFIFQRDNNPLIIGTNNLERLRITSAGLVGIGTSAPSNPIHVTNSSSSVATAYFNNTSTGGDSPSLIVQGGANNAGTVGTFEVRDYNGNTDFKVQGDGKVGIGTTSASQKLHIADSSAAFTRYESGSFDAYVGQRSTGILEIAQAQAGNITLLTNGSERVRCDSSGRLLVGTSSARSFFGGGDFPGLQLEGTGTEGRELSVTASNSGISGGVVLLAKQRSGTVGGQTIVQSGDQLGYFGFQGSDGTKLLAGAAIEGIVDGTPGVNDLPTRLVFSTTADGASSPTERWRIDSSGSLVGAAGSAFVSAYVYSATTATAANVNVDGSGFLRRSTSSIKYKTNVETIQDQYADAILGCRPVWYQSTCEADKPDWGHWGFIAEEVAEIDPRLCFFKEEEDGTLEPEGVQYDRFVPHLLNLIKRQQQAIETLEAKVAALESA